MSLLIKKEEGNNSKTFTFTKMPTNLNELKELDLKDEYQAVCACMFTLAAF